MLPITRIQLFWGDYNKTVTISDSDDLCNNLVRLIKRFTFNDKRSRAKKKKKLRENKRDNDHK